MRDAEFNLLDEKWILVRKSDCSIDELSLTDALLLSHQYTALSGELPTQDVSLLRLLLAVLHTVFARYAPDGSYSPLTKPSEAMRRWKELWNAGKFPEKPIRDYLASQHERFWLFHPERPFYQTNAAKVGTEYSASKLNGIPSESGNKIRLFPMVSGKRKNGLTYAEAARWLIYVNNYDDTSSKPKGKNLPSPGAGWLGKLGIITARGNTLFETLMLNLILWRSERKELWGEEKPSWELKQAREAERCEIAMPDNLSELYTLQSRRLLLKRSDGSVTGYSLLGGDFFDKADAFVEPMTIWKECKGSDRKQTQLQPRRHNTSVKMWREFAAAFVADGSARKPGIVSWIEQLRKEGGIEKRRYISFSVAAVQYGDKDFFVTDVFADELTFHTDLITELGKRWLGFVSDEVGSCYALAYQLKLLTTNIEIAAGSSPETASQSSAVTEAREQFYHEIDIPFRTWLMSIDPEWENGSDEERNCLQSWHETALRIALQIGRRIVDEAGDTAVIGRLVSNEKDNSGKTKSGKTGEMYYSAASAYNGFVRSVNKIYISEKKNG